MNISIDELEFLLIRGLPVNYNGLIIKPPKISDIDKIGLGYYYAMTYPFCMQKENLQLWNTLQNDFCGKSLFNSFFIQEKYYLKQDEGIKPENSIIALLAQSLCFFFGIDMKDIEVLDDNKIVINYKKEAFGKMFNIPFELNEDNFEELSELIRTITCTDIIKEEKEEIDELEHYDDENLQRILEEQYRIYKEDKKKEENENKITINQLIGSVCMNENSKYNFSNISTITVWQLHYYFNFLLEKENIEITKSQFTSGNYNFEKVPDLNWIKKTKVKLSKCKKLINE
jgi:hypothetical protein